MATLHFIQPTSCLHWFKIYLLYKKAFPISERKPFALIYKTFHSKNTNVWYIENNQQFIGLVITMNDQDLVLMDYFAIEEKYRNQGYGSLVMQWLKEYYANNRLFIEIESTKETCDNLAERLRRKHFYLNNGMQELNIQCNVFGVNMELLSFKQNVTFEDYYNVYLHIYGKYSADHLIELH